MLALEFPVEGEGSLAAFLIGEPRAESGETGPNFLLRALGPVAGALARGPLALQTLHALFRAPRPVEEFRPGLRVLPDSLRGQMDEAGIRLHGLASPAAPDFAPSAVDELGQTGKPLFE